MEHDAEPLPCLQLNLVELRHLLESAATSTTRICVDAANIAALLTDATVVWPLTGFSLTAADINGTLDLRNQTVDIPVAFTDCTFASKPRLDSATFFSLSLAGCSVPGIDAADLVVRTNLDLNEGFRSSEQVRLRGARVEKRLSFTRAELRTSGIPEGLLESLEKKLGRIPEPGDIEPEICPLLLSRATINGPLLLNGARVFGQIRMISTRVGGLLSLRGTQISYPGATSINAERLEVGESLLLNRGFRAAGNIVLTGVKIGGALALGGATLTDPRQPNEPDLPLTNLLGTRLAVGRSITFSDGFTAEGAIRLKGAVVGGVISFREAKTWGVQTLDLSGTTSREINLCVTETPSAGVNLENAKTTVLRDDPQRWPTSLALDGFRYESLKATTNTSARKRAAWLTRIGPYSPDPYEVLMLYYRTTGQDEEAKRIGFAKEARRRRTLKLPGKIWSVLLQVTVGHGYYTWIAGLWLAGLVALGTGIFWYSTPVAAVDKPPTFVPLAYTIDLLLPVGDLGQEGSWRYSDWHQVAAWLFVGAGLWLTTAVAAGLSRRLRRS